MKFSTKRKSDSGILYDGRSSPVYLRVRKAGLLLLPCNPTVAVLFCICSLKQQFIAAQNSTSGKDSRFVKGVLSRASVTGSIKVLNQNPQEK